MPSFKYKRTQRLLIEYGQKLIKGTITIAELKELSEKLVVPLNATNQADSEEIKLQQETESKLPQFVGDAIELASSAVRSFKREDSVSAKPVTSRQLLLDFVSYIGPLIQPSILHNICKVLIPIELENANGPEFLRGASSFTKVMLAYELSTQPEIQALFKTLENAADFAAAYQKFILPDILKDHCKSEQGLIWCLYKAMPDKMAKAGSATLIEMVGFNLVKSCLQQIVELEPDTAPAVKNIADDPKAAKQMLIGFMKLSNQAQSDMVTAINQYAGPLVFAPMSSDALANNMAVFKSEPLLAEHIKVEISNPQQIEKISSNASSLDLDVQLNQTLLNILITIRESLNTAVHGVNASVTALQKSAGIFSMIKSLVADDPSEASKMEHSKLALLFSIFRLALHQIDQMQPLELKRGVQLQMYFLNIPILLAQFDVAKSKMTEAAGDLPLMQAYEQAKTLLNAFKNNLEKEMSVEEIAVARADSNLKKYRPNLGRVFVADPGQLKKIVAEVNSKLLVYEPDLYDNPTKSSSVAVLSLQGQPIIEPPVVSQPPQPGVAKKRATLPSQSSAQSSLQRTDSALDLRDLGGQIRQGYGVDSNAVIDSMKKLKSSSGSQTLPPNFSLGTKPSSPPLSSTTTELSNNNAATEPAAPRPPSPGLGSSSSSNG